MQHERPHQELARNCVRLPAFILYYRYIGAYVNIDTIIEIVNTRALAHNGFGGFGVSLQVMMASA